jgi:outer membrane protein OmpA-like peptidoglycan-associated protein
MLTLVVSLAIGLPACGGSPPTNALNAADEAFGRATLARDCEPELYREAELLLEQAHVASDAGMYAEARRLAVEARDAAERARMTAQANAGDCVEAQPGLDDNGNGRPQYIDVTDYDLVPVYFAYDAANLSMEARGRLDAHGRYLAQNEYRIIIEGHCDANGTEQYNIALGDSRARTVRAYLITGGIDPERIGIVSYGEFRPASTRNELNRRAEFRLRQ